MTPFWRRGLWGNRDFMKLWFGETVSLFGSQVTALALPLTAICTLKARPAQMGWLQAAQQAPFILVALFAGVWVDRVKRRPALIGTNLGQGTVLATVSSRWGRRRSGPFSGDFSGRPSACGRPSPCAARARCSLYRG